MTAPALKPIAAARQDGKFDLPADGFVQLMPLGEFPASVEFGSTPPDGVTGLVQDTDGRWRLPIVQVIDAEAVRRCAESHAPDRLIDYEHASNRADGESRAAGWTENVAPRADGLFAGIRWTADGLADVTGGNYRYLSPVFPWDSFEHLGGNRYRPTRLDGAGLTNTPNLRGIRAVSNGRRKTEDGTAKAENENPYRADGKKVRFGSRLKQKLESDPSYVARKEIIEWGRDAVRTGHHTRQPSQKGEVHDYFAKLYDDGKEGVLVIVDVKDGEAFNLFASPPRYLKKHGYVPNSAGWDERGEQPPLAVLQAIAAAGGLPDYFQSNRQAADVNNLNPRVGNTGTAPESAERKKETETMREQLIQALGLPPEATDEDILKAVGGMQQRLSEIEQAQAEAQVENDLKELGDRVANRDVVKAALLKDRAGTLAVLNAVKKPEAKPAIVLNAHQAKTPAVEASGADRAKEQERAVEKYRVENKCSRKEAWAAVRRDRPELFKQEA